MEDLFQYEINELTSYIEASVRTISRIERARVKLSAHPIMPLIYELRNRGAGISRFFYDTHTTLTIDLGYCDEHLNLKEQKLSGMCARIVEAIEPDAPSSLWQGPNSLGTMRIRLETDIDEEYGLSVEVRKQIEIPCHKAKAIREVTWCGEEIPAGIEIVEMIS